MRLSIRLCTIFVMNCRQDRAGPEPTVRSPIVFGGNGVNSDLQGGWQNLRQAVVENHPFRGSDRLFFLIDEAMIWEGVRNLRHTRNTLLLIQNLVLTNTLN